MMRRITRLDMSSTDVPRWLRWPIGLAGLVLVTPMLLGMLGLAIGLAAPRAPIAVPFLIWGLRGDLFTGSRGGHMRELDSMEWGADAHAAAGRALHKAHA